MDPLLKLVIQNCRQRSSWHDQLLRQAVHFSKSVVRYHQFLVRIKEAQPLSHVGQRGVKPEIDARQLGSSMR